MKNSYTDEELGEMVWKKSPHSKKATKQVNSDSGLSVAIVRLRFGAAFVPIFLHHPDVANVGIIDPVREG